MTELVTVDVFVAMDSDGNIQVGTDMDEATERYNDHHGLVSPIRIVKLAVTMRPPEVTEASVTVPDEAGQQVAATAE